MRRAFSYAGRSCILLSIMLGSLAVFQPKTFNGAVWTLVLVLGLLSILSWAWRRG